MEYCQADWGAYGMLQLSCKEPRPDDVAASYDRWNSVHSIPMRQLSCKEPR